MAVRPAIDFAESMREPRSACLCAMCGRPWETGLLALPVGGGGVGEHADGEEVGEGVCDRLGRVRRVAVERPDRDCGVAAGLLGVVDQRWRIDCGRGVFEPVGGLLVGER